MMQTKSSWTPLVNKDANKMLFEERQNLILAWFTKWSESQRKQLMTKLFELCTQKQIESLFSILENKMPLYKIDFTRTLPRVLCIYLFSFLDPRSLCRCAQVSWYWRYLSESNELWASKCLRRGWDLIASHSQWEPGIWKKHYIQKIRYLQFHISQSINNSVNNNHQHHQSDNDTNHIDTTTNTTTNNNHHHNDDEHDKNKQNTISRHSELNQCNNDSCKFMIPWRAPSRKPSDIHRFNYFDNDEPVINARSSGQEFKARLSYSAGSSSTTTRKKKYSLTLDSSFYKSTTQTEHINNDNNDIDSQLNNLFKHHETTAIQKSTYPPPSSSPSPNHVVCSMFTNRHNSMTTIPWKPTSIYPSKLNQSNTEKTRQSQYAMIKKFIHSDSSIKNSLKSNKIHDHDHLINKLQMNGSSSILNESNKQLGDEINMVNFSGE